MTAPRTFRISIRALLSTSLFLPSLFVFQIASAETCKVENFCAQLNRNNPDAIAYENSEGFRIRDYSRIWSRVRDRSVLERLQDNLLLNAFGQADSEIYSRAEVRAHEIFNRTRFIFSKVISQSSNLSFSLKKALLKRVETIQLETQQSSLDDGIGPNAGYLGQYHTVHIFSAMNEMPEATLIEIFAHEIAHSFDFDNIKRDLNGAGGDWALSPPTWKKDSQRIQSPLYETVSGCLIKVGVAPNQLSEAFADVLSASVLSEYLNSLFASSKKQFAFESIAYLLSQSCTSPNGIDAPGDPRDPHPSKRVRIEKLFLGNTAIASALACTPAPDDSCEF